MGWMPALISAAGQVGSQVIKSNGEQEAAKNSANLLRQSMQGQAGTMDLGKMMLQDSSMNNSGWVVTTNGATANATANTSRTLTPSVTSSLDAALGSGSYASGAGSGAAGFDFTPLLIAGALWLAFQK